MAITVIAPPTAPTPVASGNLTLKLPGVTTDDIIVIPVWSRDNVALSITGFTQKTKEANGGAYQMWIFYRRRLVGDAETEVTVNHTAGDVIYARSIAYRGCVKAGDPFEASAIGPIGSGTPLNLIPPTVTTLTPAARGLVAVGMADDGFGAEFANFSVTNEQGLVLTEQEDFETVTGLDMAMAMYSTDLKETPGSQTGPTILAVPTAAAVGLVWQGWLTPFVPPPVPGSKQLMGVGV